jgi:glyoxylase-like metal-dependent hydrolase (beta-lactamase superfamily II)
MTFRMQIRSVQVQALVLSALTACGGSPPPTPEEPAPPPPVEAPAPPAPPEPKLSLEVVTGSPEGFFVTSTLVTGDKSAVLIDAMFTLADAKKVVDAVKASNKSLTAVYVTHWHPDHYFGFPVIHEAFPEAKLVALPTTVAEIERTWADKVKQWKPLYKDAITDQPIVPEPLSGTSLDVDGVKLEIMGGVQGDDENNSYVSVPDLGAVVTGDIVYDGVFPWTAETNPETRKAWAGTLDTLAALSPKRVIPGHQKPEQQQAPENLTFTKDYLAAFDAALASSKTAKELQTKIKAQYPEAALDIVLQIGAETALPAKSKKTAKK